MQLKNNIKKVKISTIFNRIVNNHNNTHLYGACSPMKSKAQCALQKEAEKWCISTCNGQNKVLGLTTAKPGENLHTAILVNKHLTYIRAVESYAWSAIVLAQLCTSCFFRFFLLHPTTSNQHCFVFLVCMLFFATKTDRSTLIGTNITT